MAALPATNIIEDPSRTWAAFDKLFDSVFSPRRTYAVPYDDAFNGSNDSLVEYTAPMEESTKRPRSPQPKWEDPARKPPRIHATSPKNRSNEITHATNGKTVRRQRSKVNFLDSEDAKAVTATFDLPGIKKEDVHVSYQTDRLVVTWESVTTSERKEDGRIIRERREKKYIRTIPLAEGTKFEEIKATMDGRHLAISYPKISRSLMPELHGQPISIN